MRVAITGVGTWCAAGRFPEDLIERMGGGDALTVDAPYPTDAFGGRLSGFVPGLDRGRAAEILLGAVIGDALSEAGLPAGDVGLVVGTSSGAFVRGLPNRGAPANRVGHALGVGGPTATLSVACASGTAAIAVARGWLRDGCPAVVASGVDALDGFVHAGFSGLGALTAGRPRPFAADRDGLALGEGAGALVLEDLDRARARGARILAELVGVGLSCDACHMTAPQRDGRGVAHALLAALADGGLTPADVDMVSVHGTGTPYNDAMEACALRSVFGGRPLSVHSVKDVVGHTLGAAGAIEAGVLVRALDRGIEPAPIRDVDPALPWPPPAPPGPRRVALSTSSAFGGINACVALRSAGALYRHSDPLPRRGDGVRRLASVDVALPADADLRDHWPDAHSRALRLDAYGRIGLWAVHALLAEVEVPPECGIVLATRYGCWLADEAHAQRIAAEGPGRASRIAFAGTVPSAPACEAAIQHNLRGPLLTFVGDPGLAEREAARLLRQGDAAWLIALTCDADRDGGARARASALVGGG